MLRKANTKKLIITTGIVAAAGLAFFMRSGSQDAESLSAQVKKGKFEVSITVTGELEAKNKAYINAPSELRNSRLGFIRTKIQDLVPEGTVVDSGDYVARLDESEIVNQLTEVQNEIEKQENELLKAKLDTSLSMRELRNNMKDLEFGLEEKALVVKQSIYEPPATLRQAEIALDKAKREFEEAQLSFGLKQKQMQAKITEVYQRLADMERRKQSLQSLIEKFTIYAPKHGMVIYMRDRIGNIRGIGAEIAQWNLSVATLPDMSKMISKTYVNEIDINKVKAGLEVLVKLDAVSGKEARGRITSVANVGTQLMGTDAKVFEVQIELLDSDPVMKPSMTTSNTIICQTFEDAVYVPLDAVHNNDTANYVFSNGEMVEVQLGASNENEVIIERGLTEGEEILLSIPPGHENFQLKALHKTEKTKALTVR